MRIGNKRSQIKNAVTSLLDELSVLEAFGDDVYKNGTVITFKKQFPTSRTNTWYSFAAVKANDRWHLTGWMFSGSGRTWDELVDFITEDRYKRLRIVTETKKLIADQESEQVDQTAEVVQDDEVVNTVDEREEYGL